MKVLSGTWQNLDGTPVSGGRLFLRLSQDSVAIGTTQVSTALISITLDSTGSVPANTKVWFNDELSPAGTTYTTSVVAPGGGLVWGAESVYINGATFNLSAAVPTVQNVLLANAILANPSGVQTISGFDLDIVGANLNILSGNLTVNGSITAGSYTNNLSAFATTSSAQLASIMSDETGTNLIVFNTSPTLVTPILGVAAATSINKVVITTPATGATLTIQDGTTVKGPASVPTGALISFGGPTFQKFTGTGTFTIPTGVTAVKATVVGGGGAGGGSTVSNSGGGGGAGGIAVKYLSGLTPGNTIAVTIGAGGTGVSAATGNAGGVSTIASGTQTITTVTASSGNGGFQVSVSSPGGAGATVSTNGDINGAGNAGGTAVSPTGGGGGASFLGGSGNPASGGPGNPAVANTGSGGGGAGSGSSTAGGNGSAGIVIFEWVV